MKLPSYSLGNFAIRRIDIAMADPAAIIGRDHVEVRIRMHVNPVDGSRDDYFFVHSRAFLAPEAIAHKSAVDEEIKRAIMRALEHEVDEWMTRDGERLVDPHANDGWGK